MKSFVPWPGAEAILRAPPKGCSFSRIPSSPNPGPDE